MGIDRSTIDKIAHLARLSVSEAEIPRTTEQISAIINLIDEMQTVNTEGVEPFASPLDASQRLRTDKVTEANLRETFQTDAPAVTNGLFLVPRVIE